MSLAYYVKIQLQKLSVANHNFSFISSTTMSSHHKELQDKLTIELFDLIEQSVKCKLNIESASNGGQLHLAKARYYQGSQTVAVSKLPTENSAEFNALRTIERDNESGGEFELKSNPVDKDNGYVDPLKWFGILLPRSLQLAQQSFINTLEYIAEAANIHMKLQTTITNILALRNA